MGWSRRRSEGVRLTDSDAADRIDGTTNVTSPRPSREPLGRGLLRLRRRPRFALAEHRRVRTVEEERTQVLVGAPRLLRHDSTL
jgi:hypothetical protein